MSDTPRTDGIRHNIAELGTFCRQLERELNAAKATIRQQQLLDEEILRLRERVKRLLGAIEFADEFIAMLQVGEEDMEQRDWIRAVADARTAYVCAKQSAKEAKP